MINMTQDERFTYINNAGRFYSLLAVALIGIFKEFVKIHAKTCKSQLILVFLQLKSVG